MRGEDESLECEVISTIRLNPSQVFHVMLCYARKDVEKVSRQFSTSNSETFNFNLGFCEKEMKSFEMEFSLIFLYRIRSACQINNQNFNMW